MKLLLHVKCNVGNNGEMGEKIARLWGDEDFHPSFPLVSKLEV